LSPPESPRRTRGVLSRRLLLTRRLQDVIEESVDLVVLGGPFGAQASPFLDRPEGGEDPAVEVLRATPFHRGFDLELRALLSDLAFREHLAQEWSNPLGTIGAHTSHEAETATGHGTIATGATMGIKGIREQEKKGLLGCASQRRGVALADHGQFQRQELFHAGAREIVPSRPSRGS
jgi:hypothetical protein